MPTSSFPTPEPIRLRVQMPAGDVSVEASERDTTDVDVQPQDPGRQIDVEAAEQTRVEHSEGSVVVEGPDDRHWAGRTPRVIVRVGLPEGSAVSLHTASADQRLRGRLGDVGARSASGDIRVEHATALAGETASGDLTATRVDGAAAAKTASGDLRLDTVDGDTAASTASGDATIGVVRGDLTIAAASGDIRVKSVGGSVEAKSASGDVTIGSVRTGRAQANTASGDVAIGVAEGTAAWLQLNTMSGSIHSDLESTTAPDTTTSETVEIDVRTMSGDITVKRA